MKNRLPPRRVLAPFLLMCWGFLPSGCASVFHGTTQKISVITEPSGATATLEGQSTVTPGVLRVSRKATSAEIRIEKEGYVPRTVRLTRHVSGLIWTNLGWGVGTASLAVASAPAFALSGQGTAGADALAGTGLGLTGLGLAVDFRSGGAYFLKPRSVVVKLAPSSPESPLVGTWETVSRSRGGLGAILDLNPDGSAVFTFAAMVDQQYEIIGDRLVTSLCDPETGKVSEQILEVDLDRDVLTQKGPASPDQVTRWFRYRPGSLEQPPIVGAWVSRLKNGSQDQTESVAYEMFSADGRFSFRLPIGSHCGLYNVYGDRLILQDADGPPQSFRYRIESDELVLTADLVGVPIGNRAREYRYKRGNVIPGMTRLAPESPLTP